jgi:hypothetical protein
MEDETDIEPAGRGISTVESHNVTKDSLFCPTVGPILSGDSPGTLL